MAKKLGLLSLVLCMALGLCAVTAFAANSSDNAPSAPTAEPQTAISEVSFRQNGTDIQQSMDGGKSWGTYTKRTTSPTMNLRRGWKSKQPIFKYLWRSGSGHRTRRIKHLKTIKPFLMGLQTAKW